MNEQLIKGTHHISLKCVGYTRFEEALAFYRGVLGLSLIRSWGEGEASGAMLDTGNSILELSANGEEPAPLGPIHHFALATDNVDAVVAAVSAAGYPITVEPKDAALPTDPPYRVRVAFCVGPCGESIELFCEK